MTEQLNNTLQEKIGELKGIIITFIGHTGADIKRIETLASTLAVQTSVLSSELAIKTAVLSSELAAKTSVLSSELSSKTSNLASELAEKTSRLASDLAAKTSAMESNLITKNSLIDKNVSDIKERVDFVYTTLKIAAVIILAESALIGWMWNHGRDAEMVGRTIINHKQSNNQ